MARPNLPLVLKPSFDALVLSLEIHFAILQVYNLATQCRQLMLQCSIFLHQLIPRLRIHEYTVCHRLRSSWPVQLLVQSTYLRVFALNQTL